MSFAEHSPLRAILHESGLPSKVVEYPSVFFPFPYDAMVRRGVEMTVAAVRGFVTENPGRAVRLIGYSLGARIAGDALVTLAREVDDIAGVLISDPRQPGTGMEVRRHGWRLPGITMIGERDPIDCRVLRVAAAGDPICSNAGLLGYFLHHSNYHRMLYGGQRLFAWIAQRLAHPPNQTVIV
nr:PE-PPE domain-containing protein [Hoyosella altamirensis]